MARPKIQTSVILEIKSARADRLTLDQIQDRMQDARDKGVVSNPMPGRGSIAKYAKEYDGLDASRRDPDRPFEYHLMAEYDLPWEAGPFLLLMWVWVRDKGPFPGRHGTMPLPSIRQARWWWRIHLIDPEMDNEHVWHWAQQFVARELVHDLLDAPMALADLEAVLAYRAWRPESREAYDQAIQAGRISRYDPTVEQDVHLILSAFSSDDDIFRMTMLYLGAGESESFAKKIQTTKEQASDNA
jgi:hypothetical protein